MFTEMKWNSVILGFLTNDLINIFNDKKAPFLYYGVATIIILTAEFSIYKGIIKKSWWKKFIPFYILHLTLKYSDMNRITLYFGTLGILSITFILLLVKYFLKKNKNSKFDVEIKNKL